MRDSCLELSKFDALKMLDLQTKSAIKSIWSRLMLQATNLHPTTPLIYVHILCFRIMFKQLCVTLILPSIYILCNFSFDMQSFLFYRTKWRFSHEIWPPSQNDFHFKNSSYCADLLLDSFLSISYCVILMI